MAATFDDGNDAWEEIAEEDQNVEEMRWAADDCAEFGADNMPTKEAAETAFSMLKQTVGRGLEQKPMALKYRRDFWRRPVRHEECHNQCSKHS
jgi:hypothetical protein